MDENMISIEGQLLYLLSKADEFEAHLMYSQDRLQYEDFVRVVQKFLHTCQPYFNYVESTARNSSPDRTPLSLYIRSRLLQFSQQLCSRLEQLLLLLATFGYLSLEEADPLGFSHFYIGQCVVENIKVSVFRYCLPSPFLVITNRGLYKRMRWNVLRERDTESGVKGEEKRERGLGGAQEAEGEKKVEKELGKLEGEQDNTEYYFLCCENVLMMAGEREAVVRIWSIGKWVQTYPDPHTEDIEEWVLCAVPQGQYQQLVCLGEQEPSPCYATDSLLALLLTQEGPTINNTA